MNAVMAPRPRGSRKRDKKFFYNTQVLANNLELALNDDLETYGKTIIDPPSYTRYGGAAQAALRKKYTTSSANDSPRRELAFRKFRDVQLHLGRVDLSWLRVPTQRNERFGLEQDALLLLRARHVCHHILGDFALSEVFQAAKHGPNSTADIPFADAGNSRKWTFPMSITDNCVGLMTSYLEWDRHALALRLTAQPDLPPGLSELFKVVPGAIGTTVLKNEDVDRFIAKEPTCNMFLQQGVFEVMAERLKRFGVDIYNLQGVHRSLAHLYSLTRKGATVDWTSASDCSMTELVKYLLPLKWFMLLDAVRSPHVLVGKEWLTPLCISSMGNATTFPVETLILFALGVAAVSSLRNTNSLFPEWEDYTRVSVFGDDCILPVEAYEVFVRIATRVGYILNEDKSFHAFDDCFRESCGADYFAGRNIRPFYLKGLPAQKPSLVTAYLYSIWNGVLKNAINAFGHRNYVYSKQLQVIANALSDHTKEICVVPPSFPDDSGVKTAGDWCRLQRLFRSKPRLVTRDIHGTFSVPMLRRVKPDLGTIVPEWEYWFRLKFPADHHPLAGNSRLSYITRKGGKVEIALNRGDPNLVERVELAFQANRTNTKGYVVTVLQYCGTFEP